MKILVTGGAGFIRSHTIVELYNAGHNVIVVDNLCNSSKESLKRVAELVGVSKIPFFEADIRDRDTLNRIMSQYPCEACIHFAGLKSVKESIDHPLEYYENNISGTLVLLDVLEQYNCKNLIFSSSATVYGNPMEIPITEKCPTGDCTNPYGKTKRMIEEILKDIHKSDNTWNIVILRYFNPIGAHPSGRIGENPNGTPNNLMPYITQVAIGKQPKLHVFGNDYDTPDGTGVRDYIHVVDLARGHVAAISAIEQNCGFDIYNLGTGHGYSVMDVIQAFEKSTGVNIPYAIHPRRPGDIATCYSDPTKSATNLHWVAEYGLEDMCRDAWNWQKQNPNGF